MKQHLFDRSKKGGRYSFQYFYTKPNNSCVANKNFSCIINLHQNLGQHPYHILRGQLRISCKQLTLVKTYLRLLAEHLLLYQTNLKEFDGTKFVTTSAIRRRILLQEFFNCQTLRRPNPDSFLLSFFAQLCILHHEVTGAKLMQKMFLINLDQGNPNLGLSFLF